ncbi:MAG: transcription-repair coupling factor [Desulfuromonas sp.]|nr:MAG: transcription-repair coupling factor [Desulfuromonas sp.]
MENHDLNPPEIAHATLRAICEGVAAGGSRSEVLGLVGSSTACLLARLLAQSRETLLILCAEAREAEQLATDLAFYHGRKEEILLFPHWEVGPYEPLTPHPEIEATRLSTLAALHEGRGRAVVTTLRAAMQRVIPAEILAELTSHLEVEEEYPRQQLLSRLETLGYQNGPLVEDRGSYSIRGDILDIFPPSHNRPVRIEFFGDYIERMRPFDPETQRSGETELPELTLLPAREMVLAGEHLTTFTRQLKERCDTLEIPRTQREAILEEIREGIIAPGRSFLLPCNYPYLDTLFDYLGSATWVLHDPPALEAAGDRFANEIREGEERARRQEGPYMPAASFYLDPTEVEERSHRGRRLDLCGLRIIQLDQENPSFRIQAKGNNNLRLSTGGGTEALAEKLREARGHEWRQLIVCRQRGQAERLLELLAGTDLHPRFEEHPPSLATLKAKEMVLTLGELSAGFRLPDEKLAVITEEEIFGERVHRRGLSAARSRAALSTLAQLREGDHVVHADHGIATYCGLLHLATGGVAGDYLHLEYAAGDRLYLPIDRIEKVQKYVGGEGHTPRLDKMGGGAWEKAKVKARAAIEELARDLLRVYARREMAPGFKHPPPDRIFREFEAAFPYEETPDQLAAINDVVDDLLAERPMDRLVCGDVGYGKTEVAIRAAFMAALAGRQVAVLVPTTILARQHWENFRERFKQYPVEVDMVSRFRSTAEQKKSLERTAAGQIDILIGTHRLLQRDVRFKNLGMVIIDEEQRFGVRHKEKLKKMRAEVDVLTLTATPIPRTLHMGMMGLRDLSVIDTPPVDRLAIRTYVTRFDDDLVREAILRELRRGGQVFFVHNRVQSISAMADFIRNLVPEAKVAVGHGQMGEKELEEVMLGFVEGKSNVLVSSTIIENGLDISRANTIIINRADCFGLSQLYQLRGRVGRSRQRAYAYFLIPGEGTLTRDARERLKVLQELTELGAGFRVASHDLELRGAGDLLGANQSGQIAAIGFEMYTELLEESIAELKGEGKEEQVDPEIRLGLSAYLPEKYVADPNQRLVFYKRMAAANDEATLYDVADELRDRYGEIPEAAETLIEMMKLRVLLKELQIEQAEYDGRQLVFGIHAGTPIPPEAILGLLQQGERYRFTPDYRLHIATGKMAPGEVLTEARKELKALQRLC